MTQPADQHGMVHLKSPFSASVTVDRLRSLVLGKGLTIFAVIDHSAAATSAGLSMPPATVLIFGSPKSGTALMIAAPTLAIDLPLKALVWEDPGAQVWLSYNTPEYLAQRHGLADSFLPAISGVRLLCEAAVKPD
jgi:uncharacterized protein (DUF302 family)